MTAMRAKMYVSMVQESFWGEVGEDGKRAKSQETLTMSAVAASKYPDDGSDEDNTYAKFSPGANLNINIANPALWEKFEFGQKYYVDFTAAEK